MDKFNKYWDYNLFDDFIKLIKSKISLSKEDKREKEKKAFDYEHYYESMKNFGKTIDISIKIIVRITVLVFTIVVVNILSYLFIKTGIIILKYLNKF